MDEYKKYEPIFGSWTIERLIGKGSFGKVFEISREDFGTKYRAALKIISVPQDEDDVKSRMAEGTELDSITEYYEGILKEIINENEIMSKLKGNSNIVSYEDHQVIPHEDSIGYDILIRMELLTPLLDRMVETKLDEKEVVKLGIDMCKALELCHKKKIIHRDIKPQNIFISDSGDYKLGDFGIARTMEKTTGGMSKKGTYKYMAPEVFKGDDYDHTVDIYSLGIVLYSLLNGNRSPFLPAPPAKITHNDEEEARTRRFRGEPLPPPRDAGAMLTYILRKAAAANPAERYQTAGQFKKDLESYLKNYNKAEETMGFDHEATVLESNIPAQSEGIRPLQQGYTGSMPPVGYMGSMPPVGNMPQQGGQYAYNAPYAAQGFVERAPEKKAFNLKVWLPVMLIGIIAIAAVTAFILIKSANTTEEIKLSDYMTKPLFSGYDEGQGVVKEVPVIDEDEKDEFLDDIKDEKKRDSAEKFFDSVIFTMSKTGGLSNGDEIDINVEYDSELADEAGIKIKNTKMSVIVDGLQVLPSYTKDPEVKEEQGHYYKVVNVSLNWDEAMAACEAEGGHLATITSAEEQAQIMSLIEQEGTKYNYWLGGADAGHEGTWTWITGEPWGYKNWRENQPDNGRIGDERAQDYLSICMVSAADTGRYGKWWDNSNDGVSKNYIQAPYYKDTQYYGYICEWDGIE